MKVRKKCRIVLIIVLVLVGVIFLFRSYYYLKISKVKLPEDANTIKTQISVSDTYGYHVCAEKVVESELEYEQFVTFIRENNSDDNIHVYSIYKENSRYAVWLDDYSVSLVNSIAGKEKDGMNYYLITNNSPYGSFFY